MAKLPASKALESYRNRTIQDLSSTIKERTKALRRGRSSISFKEEDEVNPPKPSEILKEYKAQIEMEKLAETERDASGEYIGAPVGTQSPTTIPVKPGIKTPPKPGRPGPFKKPKIAPKPKAGKSKTPDWFNFDEIKSDVEKKK